MENDDAYYMFLIPLLTTQFFSYVLQEQEDGIASVSKT